ncbi:peptidylprolyl isomerase [Kordiimonas sp. SCSIO 12603]|uniref:peptidylprolyl isomerase n=1 Tax=Kordiimonas sp. SCSIO 12603 TaxID=2829596 RepID=UPI002106AC6D|nr:peptidylprolyl isomerase [Kordiimonas sp. SCSIO 12603]UTW57348.1 peptidylprolyl isomerase [Kordiimonas sp. SCSIO 12603]
MIKKTKKLVKNTVLGSAVCVALTVGVSAQQAVNSIEVLVNDEPISSFDIDQRLRLVIALSGGVNTQEEFLKVREQVLRTMIDERLQLQEAATVDLVIAAEQLDDFFARRAQGVGQTADQFASALTSIGSSKRSMQKQMEAEVAWSQLVEGRLGSFVSVSDEEVEARIQKIRDNRGKFEYRLNEIVFDVNTPEQEASIKSNAEQIVERLRAGAKFDEIAKQLSSSPSAAVGGDLGWITVDSMNDDYAGIVEGLDVGKISDPVRTAGGFAILGLGDRRRVLVADPLDTEVDIRQLHLSTEKVADTALATQFETTVQNLHTGTVDCASIDTIASTAGADGRVEIGALRLRALQGEIRTKVEVLDAGGATDMIKMDDGWRVLVVCDKRAPQVQEPDFDQIMNQIEQQRLAMMGRRYLRDLRRDAIIDYR